MHSCPSNCIYICIKGPTSLKPSTQSDLYDQESSYVTGSQHWPGMGNTGYCTCWFYVTVIHDMLSLLSIFQYCQCCSYYCYSFLWYVVTVNHNSSKPYDRYMTHENCNSQSHQYSSYSGAICITSGHVDKEFKQWWNRV